jgi:hypothetical protein
MAANSSSSSSSSKLVMQQQAAAAAASQAAATLPPPSSTLLIWEARLGVWMQRGWHLGLLAGRAQLVAASGLCRQVQQQQPG